MRIFLRQHVDPSSEALTMNFCNIVECILQNIQAYHIDLVGQPENLTEPD